MWFKSFQLYINDINDEFLSELIERWCSAVSIIPKKDFAEKETYNYI